MRLDPVIFTERKYEAFSDFWKNQISDAASSFIFRQKKPKSYSNNEFKLGLKFKLKNDQKEAINQLVKHDDAGIFVCFITAMAVLLKKYSGLENIIINSPLVNIKGDIEDYSINRVPLLLCLKDDDILRDCLNNIQQRIRNCYRYQGYPLSLIKTNNDERLFQTNILIRYQPLHPIFVFDEIEEDLFIDINNEAQDFLISVYYRPNYFILKIVLPIFYHRFQCSISS